MDVMFYIFQQFIQLLEIRDDNLDVRKHDFKKLK